MTRDPERSGAGMWGIALFAGAVALTVGAVGIVYWQGRPDVEASARAANSEPSATERFARAQSPEQSTGLAETQPTWTMPARKTAARRSRPSDEDLEEQILADAEEAYDYEAEAELDDVVARELAMSAEQADGDPDEGNLSAEEMTEVDRHEQEMIEMAEEEAAYQNDYGETDPATEQELIQHAR